MSYSTRTDTTILRGPCAVKLGDVLTYAADKVDVKTTVETFQVPTAHAGPIGQRVKQIIHEITFKPVGTISSGILDAFWPHTAALPGNSAMPATPVDVTIWPMNGKEQVIYKNGFVSKQADLLFSALKPLADGNVTLKCIGKDAAAWSAADKQLVYAATAAFTDTSFSLAAVKTVPYSAALGTLSSPWNALRTKNGVKVSFDIPLDEETYNTDSEGLIGVLYKEGAKLTVKFEPIGVSVNDLLALLRLQGSGAARGMDVSDLVNDLAISGGTGNPTATFKNLQLLTAPSQFKVNMDRVPELDFVTTRVLGSDGVTLADLFSLGVA